MNPKEPWIVAFFGLFKLSTASENPVKKRRLGASMGSPTVSDPLVLATLPQVRPLGPGAGRISTSWAVASAGWCRR